MDALNSSTPGRPGVDVEALLDEGAWVRALAQRLVGAGDADDVAQDTFVAALEGAPRDPLHRRSWLARVTMNFARLKRRGDAHRTQREMRASHPEAQPSASETLERLEAQRALVDALRALDEPYRTTVMRRYFDNESAADIARAENVPAATVRWRLMRGVEDLRAKLDQRYGDRASWSIAFVPLVRHHATLPAAAGAGTSAATITGVLVMNALSRTALVAALVVSGSLGVWLVVRPTEPLASHPVTPSAETKKLAEPVVPDPQVNPSLVASSPSEGRAAVSSRAVDGNASAAELAPTSARMDGRFVDAQGHGVAAVEIVDPPAPDQKTVKSDEHGAFQLDIPLAPTRGSVNFEARCPGWATFFGHLVPRPGQTEHMGDIVLQAGGSIAGVVLDEHGAPVAKADVIAIDPQLDDELDAMRRQGPGSSRVPEATSAGDGSFRIDGVPAKLQRAWAHANGTRWSLSEPIDVPPGGVYPGVVLTLEPLAKDDRIEGIVLDPDGKPIPQAQILFSCASAGSSWSSSTTSGGDGRFQILVTRKVPHDLGAIDRESRWPAVNLQKVEPGTLDVVLRFKEPRHVDLVVVDEHAAPIEEFGVNLHRDNGRDFYWDSQPARHDGGRLSIPVPEAPFVIEVWAHGHEENRSAVFDPAGVPSRVDMTLASLPGVRGHVTFEGKPVSGAKLELHDVGSATSRMERSGWLTRINPNVITTETTDQKGEYEITTRKAGRFVIVCEAAGFARAVQPELQVDPKVGVKDFDVKLGRGGAIEGHVLVPDGRDPGGVIVGITHYDLAPRTLRTGTDGSYRFEGLTPGEWRVMRAAAELDPSGSSTSFSGGRAKIDYPTDCVVEEGQVTRFDLDLRHSFDVVFVGHVTVNGAPAVGWSVELWPDDSHASSAALPGGTVDASGTVRILMPSPSKVRAQLRPLVEGTSVEFRQVLDLRAGDNPWVVDVVAGSIEGQCTTGGAHVFYTWSDGGPLTCTGGLTAEADGRFRLPLVPAGHGKVQLWSDKPSAVGRDVDVKRGETARVDLP